MTKSVRIENADASQYAVIVEVWDKGYPAGSPDKLARTITLSRPTEMAGALGDLYLTDTRYFIVREGTL